MNLIVALLFSQIFVNYTSVGIFSDTGGDLFNRDRKVHEFVYEPNKDVWASKVWGKEGDVLHLHRCDGIYQRISILKYETPRTEKTIRVRNSVELEKALSELTSNTEVVISKGVYHLQAARSFQNTFVGLENVVIRGSGVVISGYTDSYDNVLQAHLNGERMNPVRPDGIAGSSFAGHEKWTYETLMSSSFPGYMFHEGKWVFNRTGDIKVSNPTSPHLWLFHRCRNIEIRGITVEGYSFIAPNASMRGSAFEFTDCQNVGVVSCKFHELGSCAIRTSKCNLMYVRGNYSRDGQSQVPYMIMRHSDGPRPTGGYYFQDTINASIINCTWDGTFCGIWHNNSHNCDVVQCEFIGCRNHTISFRGKDRDRGLNSMVNCVCHWCGPVLPSNEEKSPAGPNWWIGNKAYFCGYDGPPVNTGRASQGNRIGGTSSIDDTLGGMYVYSNYLHIKASITDNNIIGLNLSDRRYSVAVFRNNTWIVDNDTGKQAWMIRHYEPGGRIDNLEANLKALKFENNKFEPAVMPVFFGNNRLTVTEFLSLFIEKSE
jgi:hypothetical protein